MILLPWNVNVECWQSLLQVRLNHFCSFHGELLSGRKSCEFRNWQKINPTMHSRWKWGEVTWETQLKRGERERERKSSAWLWMERIWCASTIENSWIKCPMSMTEKEDPSWERAGAESLFCNHAVLVRSDPEQRRSRLLSVLTQRYFGIEVTRYIWSEMQTCQKPPCVNDNYKIWREVKKFFAV